MRLSRRFEHHSSECVEKGENRRGRMHVFFSFFIRFASEILPLCIPGPIKLFRTENGERRVETEKKGGGRFICEMGRAARIEGLNGGGPLFIPAFSLLLPRLALGQEVGDEKEGEGDAPFIYMWRRRRGEGGRSRLSRRPVSEFGKQTHFAFPVEGGRKGASSLLRTLAVVIFGPEHRLPPTFFTFYYFPTSSFLEKIMYSTYFLYMSLSRSDAGACVPRIFFSYSAFSPRFLLQVT